MGNIIWVLFLTKHNITWWKSVVWLLSHICYGNELIYQNTFALTSKCNLRNTKKIYRFEARSWIENSIHTLLASSNSNRESLTRHCIGIVTSITSVNVLGISGEFPSPVGSAPTSWLSLSGSNCVSTVSTVSDVPQPWMNKDITYNYTSVRYCLVTKDSKKETIPIVTICLRS